MKPKFSITICVALGLTAGSALSLTLGETHGAPSPSVTTFGSLPLGTPDVDKQYKMDDAQAAAFPNFTLYSAGPSTDGLQLSEIVRMIQSPSPTEAAAGVKSWMNMVDFSYGSCSAETASDEASCSPPLEVQVWPSCDRNLSLYPPNGDLGISYEKETVNGRPAAEFDEGDGGRRLEVYYNDVTVVIFADSSSQAADVAAALQPVNKVAGVTSGTDDGGGPLSSPIPAVAQDDSGCPAGINVP